jgi:acetylornithine deacetylase
MGAPSSPAELLARMVSFDTVNPRFGGSAGGEAALAADLEGLALGWGLQARRCGTPDAYGAFNLLVTCEPVPGGEWILFESHLDTVGVEGMTIDPFGGRIDGGRVHGRGTCDTKGSGAAALWALREYGLRSAGPRNVGLLFACDEEARMTGAEGFARGELSALLPRLRGVVVGEPTSLRPIVAHNGVMRWRSVTHGVAAHSADPSKGKSAIAAMVRVIEALEARFVPLANRTHPLTGRAAASINVIRGGSAVNIIPARCEIECDRRMAPGETAEQVLGERDAALAGLAVEHDSLYVVPPFGEERGRGFHAWLSPILARHGIDPAPRGEPYVTDASHYAAAGAPAVVLGPGGFAQAHTKDEWIALDQLDLAVKVYGELMASA